MSFMVPSTIYDSILDERSSDISTPAQPESSTTLRLQSIDHSSDDGVRDEDYQDIVVPSQDPPTTPALHSLKDRDARNREDSRTSVSAAPATVDHSIREARNEGYHGNQIQTEMPLVTPKHPSIDHGDGAGEVGHEVDPDLSTPKGATTVTTEPHSVNFEDRVGQPGNAPSTSFFPGANITGSPKIYNIGRDATIIRIGDNQFTDAQRELICDYIANLLPDIGNNVKKHVLIQSIISLPRAKAVFDDYQNKKKSGPCLKGTREALLREMADWAIDSSESRMYILSGLAGIGKSTVAYTIASRAADLNLLGASFFFSRDEADRKNAEFFFTTIAYQLCVYKEIFAKAIGDVLLTERGSAATTKGPEDQLQALILEPLQSIIQSYSRPILVVVDALDECDRKDVLSVLSGLRQLVRALPSIKVIMTTRPRPHLDRFFCRQDGHKVFHLQDIKNKVVDSDLWLYFNHRLSVEQVQERLPTSQWCVSDNEVDTLVRAAGRLFIIASTVVRIILYDVASNPAAQMQRLLGTFAQGRMPFQDLNEFYTVILRNAVPADCDVNIVNRYQSIIGAIIFVQHPLPITALAHLIDMDVKEIHAVLVNLRSVILLGDDDIPRIYHKSFPDYITDLSLCQDVKLRIDPITRHMQIAICCFKIMNKHLKRNILGFGDPARFMSNEESVKADRITDEQIQKKIPQQLRYACAYWVNHLEVTKLEDEGLVNGLAKFAHEHVLYWLEVLSLIGKLDSAHRAISVVLKLVTSTSSDLYQLLSGALCFISKFYEIIKRSALHTYYSALPFTPTNSLLYRRYMKEAEHNMCTVEGAPENWDALVASLRHKQPVQVVKFSLDSTLFVSCSRGKLKIWDAATSTPISTIPGHKFAVANDFSTVASSQDNIAMLHDAKGSPSGTIFITFSKIEELALSTESSRVAAAFSDGTAWLWDSGNTKLIDRFDGFKESGYVSCLQFSPTGTRLAYSSRNGIKLRDGISGRFVANLRCGSGSEFEFSSDGSRIASLSHGVINNLTLWNSESGQFINAVSIVDHYCLETSANGFLLATADFSGKVTLWSENRDHLVKIKVLAVDQPGSMALSRDNILAITTYSDIKLYNVDTHSYIHTLSLGGRPTALAFSHTCTRLAIGDQDGNVNFWDIRVDASSPPSKGNAPVVTALTLSRDCSRLACGFGDGTVELWGTSVTNFTKRRISPLALRSKVEKFFICILRQSRHTESVRALGFNPDGRQFASGSDDRTIKLWNGVDGVLRGTLKVPRKVQAVALSNSVVVAAWGGWRDGWHDVWRNGWRGDRRGDRYDSGVAVWSLDTLNPIHTFKNPDGTAFKVSIAEDSTLIAVCLRDNHVILLDVVNRTTIRTVHVPSPVDTMTFLPDNSQLVVQSDDGIFQSFNLYNNTTEGPMLKHFVQLPSTPLWHDVPVWHCKDEEQHFFAALFSQHKSPVPVLWIPKQIPVMTWTQGSSMIALGCKDGRVILLRLPTNHVS